MAFIPDTNILIAWARRGDPNVIRMMAAHRHEIWLSSVVLFEIYFGAFSSERPDRNLREIEGYGLPEIRFDRDDARAAGQIRAKLKRLGTPIGPYDLLIAGQALARDFILVTNNTREFQRIEGLKLEDWTA